MFNRLTSRSNLGFAAGLSALSLAALAMLAPSVASAQDRGHRGDGGGRGEGRGAQVYQNRGERMGGMQQRPQQQQQQAQQQQVPQQRVAPPAPAAEAARNYRAQGNRNNGYRGDPGSNTRQQGMYGNRGEAGRGQAGAARVQNWNGNRNGWQYGQRDAYRNEADRASGQAQDRSDARRSWQTGRNGVSPEAGQVRGRGGDGRVDGNRWQNDRRGSNGQQAGRGGNSWSNGRGDNRGWDRGWRSNSRYDWSSYRSRNRNIYSSGRYYSPYQNYSYRRLGIGLSLGSLFYGSRYWIDDPYYYRLPEVYGSYRWVRYYDDVLLVDTYTGEVVDAIYDFFR